MYEKKEDNKQQTILGNQSIFLKEVASSDVVSKFGSYIHRNENVHFNSNFNKNHTYPDLFSNEISGIICKDARK